MDVITEAEALAAEAARYAAQTTGDFATLEKLIGDDLVYYHSSSVIDTKKSFIASQTSGNVKYRKMTRGDCVVRTYGPVAIITGPGVFEVTVKGEEKTMDLLFHAIWVKRGGQLQFVSWQATRRS
jgi:hypothetical protein